MHVKKKKGTNLFDLGRQMQEIVDRAFRQAMFSDPARGTSWIPPMDIAETADAVHVVLEAPGLQKDDLQVDVEQQVLRIQGRRCEFLPPEVIRCHHIEIDRGTFERVIPIPPGFRLDEAEARLEDGLLHIRLPKKSVGTSRIEVSTSDATEEE